MEIFIEQVAGRAFAVREFGELAQVGFERLEVAALELMADLELDDFHQHELPDLIPLIWHEGREVGPFGIILASAGECFEVVRDLGPNTAGGRSGMVGECVHGDRGLSRRIEAFGITE